MKNNAGPLGEDAVATLARSALVPKTPEIFTHDADGNLTADGQWSYSWDAENRLVAVETLPALVSPAGPLPVDRKRRVEYTYDAQHRRVARRAYSWNVTTATWTLTTDTRYLYDGWNVIAEFAFNSSTSTFNLNASYAWGLDLSGTRYGAGGIGGLLFARLHLPTSTSTHAAAADGNGNILAYYDAATGERTARFEYGPFGELLVADGTAAEQLTYRFSTKPRDPLTDTYYYGYRHYSPTTGRWLSRDPIEEQGGVNLYGFVANEPVTAVDPFGLVLVAIDGTDSFDWVFRRGAGSHVLQFYKDWRGPGRKLYLDGPSLSGRGIESAIVQGIDFICSALEKNSQEPIFLIGHSRGGLIANSIARRLSETGCKCVPVRPVITFLGLYDAVDMSTHSGGSVPPNVQVVAHGRRNPVVGSRPTWGGTALSGGQQFEAAFFKGTHSAMGGDPLNGDVGHPYNEHEASRDIDTFIRSKAVNAGAILKP